MRNYVNIVVVVIFIAVFISADEIKLTFQEGDGGERRRLWQGRLPNV